MAKQINPVGGRNGGKRSLKQVFYNIKGVLEGGGEKTNTGGEWSNLKKGRGNTGTDIAGSQQQQKSRNRRGQVVKKTVGGKIFQENPPFVVVRTNQKEKMGDWKKENER